MTTIAENKAAFIADYKARNLADSAGRTRSIEYRRATNDVYAEEAWASHMKMVVTGKTEEAPVSPCNEPEWSSEYSAHSKMGGYITTEQGGVRTSKSAAESCRDGRQTKWVVVGLHSGPAAVTVEEAYNLGARELKAW